MRMFRLVQTRDYRPDIDGLRAITVLAVIIFHFGYLPNGFLCVDIFFVISGYLITGIIYNEISETRFSIVNFYLSRARRIISLTLVVCLGALVVGVLTMLPNDLKSLAQSVLATSFFSNNILQDLTVKNYWYVVNDYKPLTHTWSLGIEERYYLLYPIIFLVISRKKPAWLLPLLFFLTIVFMVLFFLSYDEYKKFYLLPFRFYELSIGGIAAVLLKNKLPLFLLLIVNLLVRITGTLQKQGLLISGSYLKKNLHW